MLTKTRLTIFILFVCLSFSFAGSYSDAQTNPSFPDGDDVYVLKHDDLKEHICIFADSRVVVFHRNRIVYQADDLAGASFATLGKETSLVTCTNSGELCFVECRHWKIVRTKKLSLVRYAGPSILGKNPHVRAFKSIPGTSWFCASMISAAVFWNATTDTYKMLGFDGGGVTVVEELKGTSKALSNGSSFWHERMLTTGGATSIVSSRPQKLSNGKYFVSFLSVANGADADRLPVLDIFSFPDLRKVKCVSPHHATFHKDAKKFRTREVLCCGGTVDGTDVVTFNCQNSNDGDKYVFGFAQFSDRLNRWKTIGKPRSVPFGPDPDPDDRLMGDVWGNMNISQKTGVFFLAGSDIIHVIGLDGKIDLEIKVPKELKLKIDTYGTLIDKDRIVIFNQRDFKARPGFFIYSLSTGKWEKTLSEKKQKP